MDVFRKQLANITLIEIFSAYKYLKAIYSLYAFAKAAVCDPKF